MEKAHNIKDLIKKISTTIESSDNKNISLIEKDILLQEIRILYSKISNWEIKNEDIIIQEQLNNDIIENTSTTFDEILAEEQNQNINPVLNEVETPKETVQEEIILKEIQEKIDENIEKKKDTNQNNFVQTIVFSETDKKIIGENLNTNKTSINDILAQNKKADVSSIINKQPITNIKSAIGIGDRFLFIRELFNKNSELYEETINKLNMLSSFDDAKDYLLSNFEWNENNETVNSFFAIIKRKWL